MEGVIKGVVPFDGLRNFVTESFTRGHEGRKGGGMTLGKGKIQEKVPTVDFPPQPGV